MKPTALKAIIEKNSMSLTKAAKEIGISRQALQQRVRRHFDRVIVLMPKARRKR